MPRYFFDIEDGHTLIDASGFDCKNDAAAIEKAKILAIGVSFDKPEVDPTRHIAVRDLAPECVSVGWHSKWAKRTSLRLWASRSSKFRSMKPGRTASALRGCSAFAAF
jgi:hypothetical protein